MEFTKTEHVYFEALKAAYPHLMTRDELRRLGVPVKSYSRESNLVDVHIGNLRRKLKLNGSDLVITKVRGIGYKLEKPI